MKKTLLFLSLISLPLGGFASIPAPQRQAALQKPDLPASLTAYSKTATLQWGCPVSDKVAAASQDEALQKIRTECVEEVSKAASEKPGVMNVLKTRVVWPDVRVSQLQDGFQLEGTFFLETLVVQKSAPGDK